MIDRDQRQWLAYRTHRGYLRFVKAGKYTWRECIQRNTPGVMFLVADLDAIEAEILALIANQRKLKPLPRRKVLDKTYQGKCLPALPGCGRRVVKKGHEFS